MQTADMPSETKNPVSFEMVFKEPSKEAIKSPIQSPPKPSSLEEIQKKLDAADERRKANQQDILERMAKKKDESCRVKERQEQEDANFKKETEEKIKEKDQKALENKLAQDEMRIQKQKEYNEKMEKVRAKKKEIGDTDETCTAADMTRAQ